MDEQNRTEEQPRSFFAFLAALPALIAARISASLFGRFFCGYDKSCELLTESRTARAFHTGRLTAKLSHFRYRTAQSAAKSRILALFHRIFTIIQQTRLRAYGLFFITFGAYTVLVYIAKYFAFESIPAERSGLITGIILAVLGLLLLFTPLTLHQCLEEGRPLGSLLYRIAGLRIYARKHREKWQINLSTAFFLGSIVGVAGFFIHPLWLLGGIFGLTLFCLLLYSPEFSLLFGIFISPFLIFVNNPSVLLAVTVLIGSIGYIGKLFLGRRTFHFEPTDLGILALAVLYIASCFFTRGGMASVADALLAVILLMGYFLAANLINTPAMLSRAISTLLAGSGIVATIGVLQQLTGHAVADWLDNAAYDYISGRITSTFANPNILAVYLVLVLPFALARAVCGQKGTRFSSGILFALLLTALVFTWSRGAWIGMIAAFVLFVLLCRPGAIYIVLPLGIAAPFALQAWLPALADRLSSSVSLSDSSVFYRSSLWRGVWDMIGDNFIGGIGVGEKAFTAVYPFYAHSGIESAQHAHNLYLQYFAAFGFLGPVLFVGAMLLILQCLFTRRKAERVGEFQLYLIAAVSAIIAILINGVSDYVFYNYRIFYLFFTVCGIAVAVTRVGRREELRALRENERGASEYSLEIEIE